MDSLFSLCWRDYNSSITEAFGSLLMNEDLVDVTLSCEGKMIKAHKTLLSSCSPYFLEVFKENPCQHPVIVFRNVQYVDLRAIVEFMYKGEVNILQEQLESFISTADMLSVKGLTDGEGVSKIKEFCEEKMQTEQVKEQLTNSSKTESFDHKSPLAKKRKPSSEKPNGIPLEKKVTVKEEPEKLDTVCDNVGSQVSDPLVPKGLTSVTNTLGEEREDVGESLKVTAHPSEEVSSKEILEEVIQVIEEGGNTKETAFPDSNILGPESKTSIPLKKRKNLEEEESEIPVKLEKITSPGKCTADSVTKVLAEPVKGKVHIPKGLVVTTVKAKSVEGLFDFPTQELQTVQDETIEALRSEDATTPVHEETTQDAHDNVPLGFNPELAEEAPTMQSEQTELEQPVEEEPKEPEFDYFGCEICQTEAKPVDLERIVFSHKCPICPCACFCSHLLKEHMKIVHGWFNVQRRYTQF